LAKPPLLYCHFLRRFWEHLGTICPSRRFTASRCAITLACVIHHRGCLPSLNAQVGPVRPLGEFPGHARASRGCGEAHANSNLGSPARLHADRNPLFRKLLDAKGPPLRSGEYQSLGVAICKK